MQKITQDTTIHDCLTQYPQTAAVFMAFGLHCLGCPGARGEVIATASAKHGVPLTDMLEKLNAAIAD